MKSLLRTDGPTLFAALLQLASEGAEGLYEGLCAGLSPEVSDSTPPPWKVRSLLALAWCVERAAEQDDEDDIARVKASLQKALDRSARELRERLKVEDDVEWREWEERARLWIRTLAGARVHASTTLPIAGAVRGGDGFAAMIELEVLANGIGDVARHPTDALDIRCHRDVTAGMRDAWRAARQGIGEDTGQFDGRWRFAWPDRRPQEAVAQGMDGRSASAAAARGWGELLRSRVPERRIVVVGRVEPSENGYTIGSVSSESLEQKVKAIKRAKREARKRKAMASPGSSLNQALWIKIFADVDTIVVPTGNRAAARTAQGSLLSPDLGLRVLPLSTGPSDPP